MKLSHIVFFSGLSSLAFSCLIFWQRSNASPVRQTDQTAAIVQPPTATLPRPIAPVPTAPIQPVAPALTSSIQSIASSPPASSPLVISQADLQTITACNGEPGNANFRSTPNLAPGNVLGVVAQGQTVQLTGRTAVGLGGLWYEAIAPSSLFSSTDPAALNRTEAGQTGWIAGCFFGG